MEELAEALGPRQVGLVRVENLVDRAWADQPPPPARPMVAHPVALAGRDSAEKRGEIARGLVARDLAAAVLTLPDSIAWLLNVRGADIARTPVALAFAILGADGRVELFTDPAKVDDAACARTSARRCAVAPPEAFGPALDALKGRVAVDKASAPAWVSDRIAAAGRGGGGLGARPLRPAEGDQDRRRRSPARGRRTCATGRRWRSSSPGST